jgi:hypothetical protein
MRVLRAVDRAVFFETQREDAGALRESLDGAARWRVEPSDGFAGLRGLLPPTERRGCVLIDPPYEEREDFARVHDALVDSLQRFPTGVLLAWLPVKLREDFDRWFASLRRSVTRPMLASLLWVVNLGCIDLNQWYARTDDVDRPDYVHFDLDPGTGRPAICGPPSFVQHPGSGPGIHALQLLIGTFPVLSQPGGRPGEQPATVEQHGLAGIVEDRHSPRYRVRLRPRPRRHPGR